MFLLIPVAARSKASACARSLAGTAGSNPDGVHGYLSLVSILFAEGQYGVCLSLSVISWNNNPLHLQ
jgi:hypothetical protein